MMEPTPERQAWHDLRDKMASLIMAVEVGDLEKARQQIPELVECQRKVNVLIGKILEAAKILRK